jgi:RNA polymerase sigma factor (sigma-70 family)
MPGSRRAWIERRDSGDRGSLTTTPDLVERFFRHEYGRLVAVLARRVGVCHLELVEDAVQASLMAALQAWPAQGPPDNPGAWLYTVARNELVGVIRQNAGRLRILEQAAGNLSLDAPLPDAHFAAEVRDDMLRMLFICCDDVIPRESRLVLALKTLCGFSTAEIALRLFMTEANVHKRLGRARDRLRQMSRELEAPSLEVLTSRLPSVQEILYLLFNEGYLSANATQAIRRELCDEAIRLATLVAEHAVGARPETFALLALMHLHSARLAARIDDAGGLLLLEEQDRALWDPERMRLGMEWLAQAASGAVFSRYHAEAAIAAEHCVAPSFAETRWHEIVNLYSMLERVAPSPLHTLNKAVAMAEWQGAEAGLALLEGVVPPSWLAGSYLWDAVLSDLHRRAGHLEISGQHRERAIASAPTEAVRRLLRRRLAIVT